MINRELAAAVTGITAEDDHYITERWTDLHPSIRFWVEHYSAQPTSTEYQAIREVALDYLRLGNWAARAVTTRHLFNKINLRLRAELKALKP